MRFKSGLAETTTAPEFVPDSLAMLNMLSKIDLSTVPESGGIFAGAIGIFSYGGISFGVGRRTLEVARELVETGNIQKLLLYFRLMNFIHHYLEGAPQWFNVGHGDFFVARRHQLGTGL